MISLLLLTILTLAALSHAYPFSLETLDRWPVHPVVTDCSGRVLLERVGDDQQWRQPVPLTQMSPWLGQALIAAEDERFLSHPGVDPVAIVRAIAQNVFALRVRSGASTLSMQVCRMIDDRPRTLSAKLIEAFRAMQLERLRTKDEILEAHLNLAPFGGNLRGVEAASQVYFGKSARDLSLGEAALLAGLPQSPSRYRPVQHPDRARARRHYVLRRMVELEMISNEQRLIAEAEPLPETLLPKVQAAPHAAWLALSQRRQGGRTTIDLDVQREVEAAVAAARPRWPANADVAVVVIDVPTGELRALVGSVDPHDPVDGQVNGAVRPRSPGSVLKPFLYAAAFEAQVLSPETVLNDAPIERAGWCPTNFDGTFVGDVSAAEALRRSLNVPAILVSERAGLARCLGTLEACGVNLPSDAYRRGGLAAAVGALDVTLSDVTNGYATLARQGTRRPLKLFVDDDSHPTPALSPNTCAAISDVLSSHRREPNGLEPMPPEQRPWFAWKTGTSSGYRDAWAAGHNQHFAVGVWVGCFSGRGDHVFVGREAAEPLLTELFTRTSLKRTVAPPQWTPWPVSTPPVRSTADAIAQLTSPKDREEFLAPNGQVSVPIRTSRPLADCQWFLNGRYVGKAMPEQLTLPTGEYHLRAVRASGLVTQVAFRVVR